MYIKTKYPKNVNDYICFFNRLSFSISYTLYINDSFYDYQEYNNLNEQHLRDVTDFLLNDEFKNKSIILSYNNINKDIIKYIIK